MSKGYYPGPEFLRQYNSCLSLSNGTQLPTAQANCSHGLPFMHSLAAQSSSSQADASSISRVVMALGGVVTATNLTPLTLWSGGFGFRR